MPTNSIWSRLSLTPRSPRDKLLAWRILRQYMGARELEREFGFRPDWLWTVHVASQQRQAIKLRLSELKEGTEQVCETVVLLPDGPPNGSARALRATVCVSSQPGCGVGCPFCLTASLGYRGNLTAAQILEQVYWAGLNAARLGRRLRNVVYMGMGEPLHNQTAVFESLQWLTADSGFGFSPRRITVSTAGVPAAMLALAERFADVRVALSLHAAQPDLRRQLVPRAVSDLVQLRNTVYRMNELQSQPVWIEIVLLHGINDSLERANELVRFCADLRVEVNLIPYNIAGGADRFRPSSRHAREAFAAVLREAGIRTTFRTSFGSGSSAACGQLAPIASVGASPAHTTSHPDAE